ncbi:MAG TPA: glycosyltransferase family 4 protein [Candidatus Thermoplasmatota archaeon]|nr:glycosyltransferase family 4 protein [Candidatus Thermoplasmatota archaeon]
METFSGTRLAVNTQTPLLRFVDGEAKQTTGGVVRMLVPLLQRWQASGRIAAAEWIAMGGEGDEQVLHHDGLDLSFVSLPEADKRGYALVKERMWELLNSNPSTPVPHGEGGIPEDAWNAFDAYQAQTAQKLTEASERLGGLDALYIHDFQQLGVAAAWKGRDVPKVFHLHTPFPSVLPSGWADYFVAHLNRYDAVVVSTRRYAQNLRAAGLEGRIDVIHPFIDPASYPRAQAGLTGEFRDRFGIGERDRLILNVGRMDPMKGQDRLVEAMPRILAKQPDARLVLVGNGSFSSSKRGGLGLDKGKEWRASLEALAKRLGVAERVTFTGHLGDEPLAAAYDACEVFALPSTREGFGLAAIEAWRNGKPVVVSDRAGVSELIEEGVNGASVDCGDVQRLADALVAMLSDPDAAREMGRAGLRTSAAATIETGQRALEAVFEEVLGERALALA